MPYDELRGLPMLNGVTIIGDRRIEDYGLVPMSETDMNSIIEEVFGYIL